MRRMKTRDRSGVARARARARTGRTAARARPRVIRRVPRWRARGGVDGRARGRRGRASDRALRGKIHSARAIARGVRRDRTRARWRETFGAIVEGVDAIASSAADEVGSFSLVAIAVDVEAIAGGYALAFVRRSIAIGHRERRRRRWTTTTRAPLIASLGVSPSRTRRRRGRRRPEWGSCGVMTQRSHIS